MDLGAMAWRYTPYFSNFQHYGNLTIRLFGVISRTLIGEVYFTAEMQSVYSAAPTDWDIYIYSHPQTDCFVLSELFSVARHAGRSKPESKPVQLYDRPHGHKRTTLAKGIFRYLIFSKQQQQPLFTFFHTLPATRELNSFEEPCITLTVADNRLVILRFGDGEVFPYLLWRHWQSFSTQILK